MKTDELREKYLEFFVSKGCTRRPSDVLVPKADPTVLFTPAGMNQFKEQFLGVAPLEFTRAATCQKCMRTGDIGNVGVTAYHHTFFEMLGNFSFGDYFKTEAIHWAWEFLTDKKWLGLNPDLLSVTVYKDDDEAFDIWNKEIGLAPERISREEEDENFWPASAPSKGPDGVCGPCSEIYYHANGWTPDNEKAVEIWNLVFTQFDRNGDPPDNLTPLPNKNIDTGMGLERTAAVLQGVQSNYEIDSLRPLCEAAGESIGHTYEFDGPAGRASRRIADHVRAVTMCLHEGVSPSGEKEGYVVRLLLRRALLEGYLLGAREPFLHTLVPKVVELMKTPYPDIAEAPEAIAEAMKEEEEAFLTTIERGMARLDRIVEKEGAVSGKDAFDLHTEAGFLIDLTESIAADRGVAVDRLEFDRLFKEFQEQSKGGMGGVMAAGPLEALRQEHGETKFLGYESTAGEGAVIGLLVTSNGKDDKPVTTAVESVDSLAAGQSLAVVLDQTPFYGEAGGQVGDTGSLTVGGKSSPVTDAQKQTGLVLHHITPAGPIKIGDTVTAQVDADRRSGIQRAHSATHIIHHALHQTLSDKAVQRGSKVQEDELRFDFSHGSALTEDELRQIEDIVNAKVSEGADVSIDFTDIESARAAGAMALFGEKYPDVVRVVSMGEFSKELCGGTHLTNVGQVGLVKVLGSDAVAKGVRRISAVTGPRALQLMRDNERLLREAALAAKAQRPEDLPARIEAIQQELAAAKAQLAKQSQASVGSLVDDLLANAEEVNGAKIITHITEGLDRDGIRDLADRLRQKGGDVCLLLGADLDGKASLLAAVSKSLTKKAKAGDCVKLAAKEVGGGGGGRPDLAEAGGKDPSKLEAALESGATYFRDALS